MSVRRDFAEVERQSATLRALLAAPEAELCAHVPRVSGWSVAQQIEHILHADRGVLGVLRQLLDDAAAAAAPPPSPPPSPASSSPANAPSPVKPANSIPANAASTRGGANLPGRLVLWTGRMPRGVARAAANLRPDEDARAAARAAAELFAKVERRIAALARRLPEVLAASRRGGRRAAHPRLGHFDAAQWVRFLRIHRDHHLRIVRDIRRAAGLRPDLPPG